MQREIEAKGIPTVLITVVPEESRLMRPPRAIHPARSRIGVVLGPPGDHGSQMSVLRAALQQFECFNLPGTIVQV